MERGDFSRPIALGDRAVGWIEEEVDAWIYRRALASALWLRRSER
jgi:predicted DNA-binding transcriptional regulator AlpA